MIYTKTGDLGDTDLVGGERVSKDDVRVEAYGTVDELNSYLGLLAVMSVPINSSMSQELRRLQRQLFIVQTLLATPDEARRSQMPQLEVDAVSHLEDLIDMLESQLPKCKAFVIPGHTELSAQCHIARTVCRRTERRVVTLSRQAEVPSTVLPYLNRLSDFLFLLARFFQHIAGVADECVSMC